MVVPDTQPETTWQVQPYRLGWCHYCKHPEGGHMSTSLPSGMNDIKLGILESLLTPKEPHLVNNCWWVSEGNEYLHIEERLKRQDSFLHQSEFLKAVCSNGQMV